MASIFDRYGLKEVSNVSIYDIKSDGSIGDLVLFLDTLKVSTIEQTAESTDATGGWGNSKLVSWDYGKEVTLSITDALLSPESMRVMMGGAVVPHTGAGSTGAKIHVASKIYKYADVTESEGAYTFEDTYGHVYTGVEKFKAIDLTSGARYDEVCIKGGTTNSKGETIEAPADTDELRFFFEAVVGAAEGETAYEITISPNTFPGTYYFVGDTLIRSEVSGDDEPYQWVLPKGKISSEITFTMEADGDPATFEFTVNALRAKNEEGKYEMMKWIKYSFDSTTSEAGEHDPHGKAPING